jgi:hypothetical protein
MTERSLQMTYRKGRPFAAYVYLSRRTGEKSARTSASADGLLIIDYSADRGPQGASTTTFSPSTVTADPRIKASQAHLVAQCELAKRITDVLAASYDGYQQLTELRSAIADCLKALGADAAAQEAADAAKALDGQVAAIQNGTPAAPGLGLLNNRDVAQFFNMLERGDAGPAETLRAAATEAREALTKAPSDWRQLNIQGVPSFNKQLGAHKLAPLPTSATIPAAPSCGQTTSSTTK